MKQIYFMTDVESDGPIPGDYSMVCYGTVVVDFNNLAYPLPSLYGECAPISEKWIPEALAISGISRELHLTMQPPIFAMERLLSFVNDQTNGGKIRPIFISDNNGYDWLFICWYLWKYTNKNPFGYSSGNINWLYKGITKNFYQSFKHLRKTKHTHNPLDDALGNAEAFITMVQQNNIKL
jgi:hypothetical protein